MVLAARLGAAALSVVGVSVTACSMYVLYLTRR